MASKLGTIGNDTLQGTSAADTFRARSGGDVINGGDGADSAAGGSGSDTINGGAGDDVLYGFNAKGTKETSGEISATLVGSGLGTSVFATSAPGDPDR